MDLMRVRGLEGALDSASASVSLHPVSTSLAAASSTSASLLLATEAWDGEEGARRGRVLGGEVGEKFFFYIIHVNYMWTPHIFFILSLLTRMPCHLSLLTRMHPLHGFEHLTCRRQLDLFPILLAYSFTMGSWQIRHIVTWKESTLTPLPSGRT